MTDEQCYRIEGGLLVLGFNPAAGDFLEIQAVEDFSAYTKLTGGEFLFSGNQKVCELVWSVYCAILEQKVYEFLLKDPDLDEKKRRVYTEARDQKRIDVILKKRDMHMQLMILRGDYAHTVPPVIGRGSRQDDYGD